VKNCVLVILDHIKCSVSSVGVISQLSLHYTSSLVRASHRPTDDLEDAVSDLSKSHLIQISK